MKSYPIDESKMNIFEIDLEPYIDFNSKKEIESYMIEITGGKTVPRIFIGGRFIGGYTDLVSLHSSKMLPKILTKSGAM